jgi:hypothetical protein
MRKLILRLLWRVHVPTTFRCKLFGHKWNDFGGDRELCARLGCHAEHPKSMPDLPEDWNQEAAFKRVADRRGLTVEELRAEIAARAKEYTETEVPQKGLDQ